MPKKYIIFFAIIIFFSSCQLVSAALSINEIMYDLSGSDSTSSKSREWVEIYNSGTGDVSIDASKWRIYDGGANRTINDQVNFSIPAGAYIILAGDKDTFLLDHVGFSGTVYDTGITSLNNTGATLKILDQDGNAVDTVAYTSSQGGAGDGNSLQKISASWLGAVPTPGSINQTPSSSLVGGMASNDGGNTSLSAAATTLETKTKTSEDKKIKTQITAQTLVFTGVPVLFTGAAFGHQGERLWSGRYFWNFGDGDSREVVVTGKEEFQHTYFYEGNYNVTLEYFINSYGDTPDATDKISIKVVPAGVIISRVGDGSDFFVELYNDSDYDADLSGWVLYGKGKSFSIPRNTILGSRDKMIISPRITHFSAEDKNNLKIVNPTGETVFTYVPNPSPVQIVFNATIPEEAPIIKSSPELISTNQDGEDGSGEVNTVPDSYLTASAVSSGVASGNPTRPYIPVVASIVFIGACASGVYFIRQRKLIKSAGEDFSILDE